MTWTAIVAVFTRVPPLPETVTANDPGVDPAKLHADV
jgi:hypothetical protein